MLKAFPLRIAKDTLWNRKSLALILKSYSKSVTQIFKKLDRRFPHGAGRLDSNWLEDEASAQLSVLGDFPDFISIKWNGILAHDRDFEFVEAICDAYLCQMVTKPTGS